MATAMQANISLVVPHTQYFDGAMVTFTLSTNYAPSPDEPSQEASYGPYSFQFPLPAQVLQDGTTIDASAPFIVPGVPDNEELYDGCMVISRFWAAQLGLPCAESDIDLTVNYPG